MTVTVISAAPCMKPGVEWLNTAKTMRSADTNFDRQISHTGYRRIIQISVSVVFAFNHPYFLQPGLQEIRKVFELKPSGRNIRPAWVTGIRFVNGRLKVGENLGELHELSKSQSYSACSG